MARSSDKRHVIARSNMVISWVSKLAVIVTFCFVFLLVWNFRGTSTRLESEYKLPMCSAFLAYQGTRTLEQTLASFSALLPKVEEKYILFQQVDSASRLRWAEMLARKYHLRLILERENVGQRVAFMKLTHTCKQPFVIVFEEDFQLTTTLAHTMQQLQVGIDLLSSFSADAVRMRSRKKPGEPHYSYRGWVKAGSRFGSGVASSHLLEHVVWDDHAEQHVTEIYVCVQRPKTWCASSRHAHYTNNPVLYRTKFINSVFNHVPNGTEVHFENWLTAFWTQQNFTVAYSDGVVTHNRVDRNMLP